jgi:tetratricopeptide (TPR) repeat protein
LINNQYNIEALQLLAVIYRLQKDEAKATTALDKIISIDPLNHFVRFEKYCWDSLEKSKENFTSLVQNEMPQQTYLELGIWYQQLKCTKEALTIFSLAAPNAELIYWQAFLQNKTPDLSNIQTGSSQPFRAETAAVLEALIKANDQWLLKYHLALIEWNRNNLVRAKQLFDQCGNQPKDPAFYAARAALMNENVESAVMDLQRAITLEPQGWRYHQLLAEHFIAQKQFEKALDIAAPFYKSHPDNYIMGMLYAKTLLLNKNYAVADAFLTKLKILPFEGATIGRQLYHEAKLMQAVMAMKKKEWKKSIAILCWCKIMADQFRGRKAL